MNERKILLLQQKKLFEFQKREILVVGKCRWFVFLCFIQMFMWNSWFDISPNKWHQKWRHKKLRSIVKKAQMTTSLYQSVYFWQLGCRDFISYCFGLAKFKLNSLNLIFSRVFLHWSKSTKKSSPPSGVWSFSTKKVPGIWILLGGSPSILWPFL